MHGDFSQLVLDGPSASRVLQQQGRVLLDADWNAACAVLLRAHRDLATDLIGPHGGPSGRLGFSVARTATGNRPDIAVGDGVYYVDGIRVEVTEATTWLTQPHAPWPRGEQQELPGEPLLVYLDVWERHVDAIQDDSLREVGLGGPDTTSQAHIVWQVRVATATDPNTSCGKFDVDGFRADLLGTPPRLRAWVGEVEDDDPCLAAPGAGYRGIENQLYRVEVTDVDPDSGQARFLWSRENGSVTAAWLDTEGDELVVEGLRDRVRGFTPGDWLELRWDELELAGEAGPRVRVVAVDGGRVRYDPASATGVVNADPRTLGHPIARRWDARPRTGVTLHGGAIDIVESDDPDGGTVLEDGIRVQFAVAPADGTTKYRVGDYWTIPARVATGSIVWPPKDGDLHAAVEPRGVQHHYAPLAILGDGDGYIDLRRAFGPLAQC